MGEIKSERFKIIEGGDVVKVVEQLLTERGREGVTVFTSTNKRAKELERLLPKEVRCLSGNSKNVRGIGRLVVLEADIPVDFILAVVAPLLRMEDSSLTLIVDKINPDSYLGKFTELTVHGEPVFVKLNAT